MRTMVRIIGAGLLGGLAIILTFLYLGQQIDGVAEGCPDIKVVWARGSEQEMNALEYRTISSEIKRRVAEEDEDISIEFHELSYPATGLSSAAEVIKIVSGEDGDSEYAQSVKDGISGLRQYVFEEGGRCIGMQYVLAGYSQGAQVVGDSLPYLDKDRISYVALFGDPKLYLPEGGGLIDPPACSGKEISSYNMWAPNCRTHLGAIGSRRPYHPVELEGRVGTWCNSRDFICGSTLNPLDNDGHTEYVNDGRIADAAIRITRVIVEDSANQADKPVAVTAVRKTQEPTDVAILVDSSKPLASKSWYGEEQVVGLWKEMSGLGGKVAVISYVDSGEEKGAKVICDLGCSEKELSSVLGKLEKKREKENSNGLLGAIKLANGELSRSSLSSTAIMILPRTDIAISGADAERYENTVRTILDEKKGGVLVVAQEEAIKDGLTVKNYGKLIGRIGGKIFWYQRPDKGAFPEGFWGNALKSLQNRPKVQLARTSYSAKVGETVSFSAAGSSGSEAEIMRYEWDFNGDGEYDKITEESTTEYTYSTEYAGFMVVKAVDENGEENTRSAAVEIAGEEPIAFFKASAIMQGEDGALIEWKETTEKYIVVTLNGVALNPVEASVGSTLVTGINYREIFNLSIYQMSEDGRKSEPMRLKVVVGKVYPVEEIDKPLVEEMKAPKTGYRLGRIMVQSDPRSL